MMKVLASLLFIFSNKSVDNVITIEPTPGVSLLYELVPGLVNLSALEEQ